MLDDRSDGWYVVVLRQLAAVDLTVRVQQHATGIIKEPRSQTQTQTQNKTSAHSCRLERSGPVEVRGESRF